MEAGAAGQDRPRLRARRASLPVRDRRCHRLFRAAQRRAVMRALILFAALLTLSPARADMPLTADFGKAAFNDSDLIPAWPESDRKREWPDGPIKDFLRDLQRPDNDRYPE